MFEVENTREAWELGVLTTCGLVRREEVVPFIVHDPALLAEFEAGAIGSWQVGLDRIRDFAGCWGVG